MSDPIRAALERLVELDGHLNETSPGWMQAWSDAIAAARAALAEPEEVGGVIADLQCAAAKYSNRGFVTDAQRCRRAATMLQQLSAPVPVVVPVAVAECPHCGYEGEMVPVAQAGEGE